MIRPPRSTGIALVLIAGLLALLAATSAGLASLTAQLRIRGGTVIDGAAARLLAGSGVEYASARLRQEYAPKRPATAGNQSDDWTCREPAGTPLDQVRNPSYAQTEPYTDVLGDGAFNGTDPFTDFDGNGCFDSWSGRLRGRGGSGSATFALRITGAGGGISVNGGILGYEDKNKNDVVDGSDLDAPGSPVQRPVVDEAGLVIPQLETGSFPNRRLARMLNHLGGILGIEETLGDRIVRNRPPEGYASMRQLGQILMRSGLGRSAWEAVFPHLSIGRECDLQAYAGTARLWPEPRIPVVLDSATPEVLAALQEGLSCVLATRYVTEGSTYVPHGIADDAYFVFAMGEVAQTIRITRRDALAVGSFLALGRPFASRCDLFRKLDGKKGTLFLDSAGFQGRLAVNRTPSNVEKQMDPPPPTTTYSDVPVPPHLVQAQFVNLVTDNACAQRAGTWPDSVPPPSYTGSGSHGRGTYSWMTYDVPRWQWSNGDLRLPRCPGVQWGETTELSMEPEGQFYVRSLGRAGSAKGEGARARLEVPLGVVQALRARTQADFENPGGFRDLGGGIRLAGDPVKDRLQSSPLFSPRSCLDLADDPRHGPHPFLGDLRLLDYSDPQVGAPLLYFPFWEVEQPRRNDKTPEAALAFSSAGSEAASPELTLDQWKFLLLTSDGQGAWKGPGRAGGFVYRWKDGRPLPGSDQGTVRRLGVEFWSDGSCCSQPQPMWGAMGPHPMAYGPRNLNLPRRYPMVLGWKQVRLDTSFGPGGEGFFDVVDGADGVTSFQEGEWHHAAFAIDSAEGQGAVRGYLDGIFQLAGAYEANAADPMAPSQDWKIGAAFDGWGDTGGTAGVDEVRIYATPGEIEPVVLARALQPRFWEAGEYLSPLYVMPGPVRVCGARGDWFAPQAIQLESLAAGAKPLQCRALLYADSEGKALLGDEPLSEDGLWRIFSREGVRSIRYRVRMDVSAASSLRDTPVFEGIAVGYARRRLLGWSEGETEDPAPRAGFASLPGTGRGSPLPPIQPPPPPGTLEWDSVTKQPPGAPGVPQLPDPKDLIPPVSGPKLPRGLQ